MKNDLKDRAIRLRKQGRSYNDIRRKLGIASKGTISGWLKGIRLSAKEKKLLVKNNTLAHKRGLFKANADRKCRIEKENDAAFDEGMRSVRLRKDIDLALIGTALYWGEGAKSERGKSVSLVFCNSDPLMVAVYMRFVREFLQIAEQRIRAGIHIYDSIKPISAKKFWSRITGLPINRFYIINQVSRASQGKRSHHLLPYGTVAIRVHDRKMFYKVKGMIEGVAHALSGDGVLLSAKKSWYSSPV